MKAARVLLFFFSLGLVPALAGAAEFKIGFLDAERINRESAPAVRASKELEKEFAPRIQELQRQERQLKDLQASIEKDGMTLSETERNRREQELANSPDQGREFQRPATRVQRRPESAPERGVLAGHRPREQGRAADCRVREVRPDPPGGRVPQPPHRHHRPGPESARRQVIRHCERPPMSASDSPRLSHAGGD